MAGRRGRCRPGGAQPVPARPADRRAISAKASRISAGGSAHGLRKSGATRLAEWGGGEAEIMACPAHKEARMAAPCFRKAQRDRLADAGSARGLGTKEEQKFPNLSERLNITAPRPTESRAGIALYGDPGRIRTCNLPLRRGLLYPVEPRGQRPCSGPSGGARQGRRWRRAQAKLPCTAQPGAWGVWKSHSRGPSAVSTRQ